MIEYSTSIITDNDLNLIDVDDKYSDYVNESEINSFISNVHSEDQHLLYEMVERVTVTRKETLCFRILGNEGEYSWVVAFCTRIDKEESFNIKIVLRDVHRLEKKTDDEDIDFGTGLLTKKAITDYARKMCSSKDNIINLCIVDIDNFKTVNDTQGHLYGDKILSEIGRIIRDVLKDGGKAGRIGGDEFMLVIDKARDKTELRAYLKGIRETVENKYKDEDGYPTVTTSIGAATFPVFADNYEVLFDLADGMLYRAKNRGKNRYVIYTPEIHGKIEGGVLKESVRTFMNANQQDKTKLVLDSLEGIFGENSEAIPSVLMKVAITYNLDEVYLFLRNINRSFGGFKKVSDTDEQGNTILRAMDSTSDLSYAKDPNFDVLFDSNDVLVVDIPEQQFEHCPAALEFFREHGIKHAFFFKMHFKTYDGYLVIYNTDELSRKIPQTDVTDFTYLSKMIEIANKYR